MASKRSTVYGSGSTAAAISESVISGTQNVGSSALSQQGNVGVQPPSAPATAPPRYQPPPQVPGILKQAVQTARPPGVSVPHAINKVQRRPNPIVGGPSTHQQAFADDDLMRLLHGVPVNVNASSSDVHKLSRKSENDATRLPTDLNQAARESARLQSLASELRSLREVNQRLSDDNQELRDLCCFLDDDRQKGRKLAREWQRFGRYTASVMRQEVSAYQNKLRQLDARQHELVRDNLELKELCLYLDEERNQVAVCPNCGNGGEGAIRPPPAMRDDGDGSSSSTNADEPSAAGMRLLDENVPNQRIGLTDEMMQYVRSLEQRVKTLEEEKRVLEQKLVMQGGPDMFGVDSPMWDANDPSSRPEAVVQALQVLEVREQVENTLPPPGNFARSGPGPCPGPCPGPPPTVGMDDGERALVREMCNVVWRKLEDSPMCNSTGPLTRR